MRPHLRFVSLAIALLLAVPALAEQTRRGSTPRRI